MGGFTMMKKFAQSIICARVCAWVCGWVCACALSQARGGWALARPGVVVPQQTRSSISQRGSVWVWNQEENGNSLEMTVRGEVEFNDAYTEVRRVSAGGSLEIRERRGGVSRRLEIEA